MSSALQALRASSEASAAEAKRLAERKRNALVLIHSFLLDNGYIESAERLQHESSTITSKYEAADNVDLGMIIGEYEAYYEMRYDKKPKLVRRLNDAEEQMRAKASSSSVQSKKGSSQTSKKLSDTTNSKLPLLGTSQSQAPESDDTNPAFGIQGLGVASIADKKKLETNIEGPERVLKPPPQFGGDTEMKQLANVISREIYQESPNVKFDDIIRLDEAKRLLSEAVQLPLRFPSLFTGILRPWKGILLHGPPGTGKTLLARAVATECQTTFFNISASTLVSKWRGDSEKLVRALFELARYHAPSTVFLDEIDSILTSRGGSSGEGSEHEASRRMKTELLIQMDGIHSTGVGYSGTVNGSGKRITEQVFVMAASNLPWDLDVAVLRRLEKRVLVSLPVAEAREAMIRKHLQDRAGPDIDVFSVASMTEGYSGADIELVCREAAMIAVRRLVAKISMLQSTEDDARSAAVATKSASAIRGGVSVVLSAPAVVSAKEKCVALGPYFSRMNFSASTSLQETIDSLVKTDLIVTHADLLLAVQTTKPSSDGNVMKYEQWQRDFGSV